MKTLKNLGITATIIAIIGSCSKNDDNPKVANEVVMEFKNTFGDSEIILAKEGSATATKNISKGGQTHYFSELKYVISNIRLGK